MDSLGDADLISGMLTAIGDFVNDSFEPKKTGELRAFAAGDLTVLVEAGPQANIAAVVRGTPPDTLPVKLQTTLETDSPAVVESARRVRRRRRRVHDDAPAARGVHRDGARDRQPREEPRDFRRFAWVVPVLLLIVGGIVWWATRGGPAVVRGARAPGRRARHRRHPQRALGRQSGASPACAIRSP